MSKINRQFFFSQVRQVPFHGSLSQKQVEGMTGILDHWEANHAQKDDRWLAYMLATAFHETATTMQPIREFGGDARAERLYGPPPVGKNPALARRLENTQKGDGARFIGRGYVQLTGRINYKDWARRLNIALVEQPDLALTTSVAVKILVEGSILGTFTGKKLANYFAPDKEDWVNARRIINGTDKAQNIAILAKQFYAAISYTV